TTTTATNRQSAATEVVYPVIREQTGLAGVQTTQTPPRRSIMKKFTVVLAALASIALAAPTVASAKEMMHKGGMHHHHGMGHYHMMGHHHHMHPMMRHHHHRHHMMMKHMHHPHHMMK